MGIIHSKNYSIGKKLFKKYSFKKFENYSFKKIIHFFEKIGYRPGLGRPLLLATTSSLSF